MEFFFDLKKAYDTAWKHGILEKLYSYGLRGNLPMFIRGFLRNRSIKVRVGKVYSDEMNVNEGVPQGSVLSCTLFIISINDIRRNLPQYVNSTLYVDDFAIYAEGSTTNLIERRLQIAIRKLEKWSNESGFRFSSEKTYALHVCRKHLCPKTTSNLSLFNNPITNVETVKYLGMIIDQSYTWKYHLSNLKARCNKTLDLFKHLTSKKWGADRKALIQLFLMLLKSKLEYGSEVYSSAATSYMKSISTIQNAALRIATGAFKTSPIKSLHADSGVLPFSYSLEAKQLSYFLRLVVNETHPKHTGVVNDQMTYRKSYMERIKNLIDSHSIQPNLIMPERQLDTPPWIEPNINLCNYMHDFKKKDFSATQLKAIFLRHFQSHQNNYCIFTDGSLTDEGVGCAFVPQHDEAVNMRLPDEASIFTAELIAISRAISYANLNSHSESVTIFSDSRSAISAITKYNNENPIIQDIVESIHSNTKSFFFCWVPAHIDVPQNEKADEAARSAITQENVFNMRLPRNDIKSKIKKSCKSKWSVEWNSIPVESIKLRRVKELPTPYLHVYFDDRFWERTLCRLRIGHTHLTHQYLMNREEQPLCNNCFVCLTVYHLIVECPDYIDERRAFGLIDKPFSIIMNDLSYRGGPLHNFIRTIDMLYKL